MKKSPLDYRAVDISFRRAEKNCIIPSNGRLALKFSPGQPHKTDSFITVAFSACPMPLYKAKGAFDKLLRICVAALLKEISTAR
ncbi:MAG: hypothetical protein JSV50_05085 [Desulfobacteraceae bacterium]|nr:MAG: hypothetical protein JSV50_05085 [Desulfobacteraceae bacterium]